MIPPLCFHVKLYPRPRANTFTFSHSDPDPEYRSSYPRVDYVHDPYIRAISLTKSPPNTRRDLLSSSTSSRVVSTTATGSLSAAAPCLSAWPTSYFSGLNVLPPPSPSNQTSTTAFQPYDDQDHDLENDGDLPLLRAPSGHSQESLRMPARYNAPLEGEAALLQLHPVTYAT